MNYYFFLEGKDMKIVIEDGEKEINIKLTKDQYLSFLKEGLVKISEHYGDDDMLKVMSEALETIVKEYDVLSEKWYRELLKAALVLRKLYLSIFDGTLKVTII